MKYLKKIAVQHKALISLFLIMGLFWTFLQNFVPLYFQTVVDNFTNGTLTVANIAVYGVAMLNLYIMGYLINYPWDKLSRSIEQSLKLTALRKVSTIDYQAYTKLGTGAIIQRIENGASAGKSILFDFYLRLAGELLPSMIFSIVFVFLINRAVMLVILLGYVIVFAASNLLLKILYKVKERILVNEEKFNHFLVRGFMEMVTFRINRRFSREIQKTKTASQEIISSAVKIRMAHEAFFTIFALLIGLVKIGIIIYGWITGQLTIGQIVALLLLVDNAYMPIAIFNVDYVSYKLEKIAFARYIEFLDTKEDARLSQGENVSMLEGCISFSKIGFSYDNRVIFDDFTLNIENGKSIAFVGESGSGKSTAIKMLAGLLQPDSGHITVDGYDLKHININSYYANIAYLPQEPSVFDGTLRENLVFDEAASDAALMNAITKAGLNTLFSKLDKGFDTPLGEKGINLSGGERQQIAIARLWFSNARIIILDEATSTIDNLTEETVMKNLMTLLKGKTVIAAAHRLDSIKTFDSIILFQDGQLAEQGRFTELLDRRQSFYELYSRLQ